MVYILFCCYSLFPALAFPKNKIGITRYPMEMRPRVNEGVEQLSGSVGYLQARLQWGGARRWPGDRLPEQQNAALPSSSIPRLVSYVSPCGDTVDTYYLPSTRSLRFSPSLQSWELDFITLFRPLSLLTFTSFEAPPLTCTE